MSEKMKYSFKCLEQECDTKACHIRQHVNVTFGDLGRWASQGYLTQILPGIEIKLPHSEEEAFVMETARKPLESDPESTACIFYHEEGNACHIRYSRPISCRTFPLEYNGEKFYLSDKNCPGVGKGEVTKEALKEFKVLAEQEYKERIETALSLPVVYSIIMSQMLRQSAEAMQNLSEEDRKRLDEIMTKSKPEDETPTETAEDT
jgi:Fe-S-cluster containining protein